MKKKRVKCKSFFKDGLKIYVTLDSKMQKYAEEAIKEHLTNLQKALMQNKEEILIDLSIS